MSDISPPFAEKCGERDTLRVTYKMKPGDDDSIADMTIWMDPSTGSPMRRRMTFELLETVTTVTEDYVTFKLDEAIDPKKFAIPEK